MKKHLVCPKPEFLVTIPGEQRKSLSLSPHDPRPKGALACSLHSHVAPQAAWPVTVRTPHAGSRAEPELSQRSNGQQLETHAKLAGAGTLGNGLYSGPTEDKIGHGPW